MSDTSLTSIPNDGNNQNVEELPNESFENILDLILTENMNSKINFARVTSGGEVIICIKNSETPVISKIEFSKDKGGRHLDWIKSKNVLTTILKNEVIGIEKSDIIQISSVLNYNFDRINKFLSRPVTNDDQNRLKLQSIKKVNESPICDTCDTYDGQPISVSEAIKLNSGKVKIRGTIVTLSEPFKMIEAYSISCSCGDNKHKVLEHPIFKMPFVPSSESICNVCKFKMVIQPKYVNALSMELQDVEKFNDMEKVNCILLDPDSRNVRIGEKVVVTGLINVLPKNQKGNLISVVFCKDNSIEWLEKNEIVLNETDIDKVKTFADTHGDLVVEELVDMFDSTIIGMEEAKEGLLYSLVSAGDDSARCSNYSNRGCPRERLHTLLIGDPGQAKSTLLRKAVNLIRGGRYETCQTSSGKSLTAIIEKDNEQRNLRLGPLSLARSSVCALNEIATMLEEDQKFLFDILEEGFFTINKHGFNSKISASTTVIASANFRDTNAFLANNDDDHTNESYGLENIPLDGALIDRFDLIMIVVENREPEAIGAYTHHKLQLMTQPSEITNHDTFLQKYIEYARRITVNLDQKPMEIVEEYYVKLKLTVPNIGSPRILDTIVRLCKAVAKLKLKEKIDENDVNQALKFFDKMIRKYSNVASNSNNNLSLTAYEECVKVLQNSKGHAMLYEDVLYKACESNTGVRLYIEGHDGIGHNKGIDRNKLRMNINRRSRRVYEMLRRTRKLSMVREKPVTFQYLSKNEPKQLEPSVTSVTNVT